MWRGEAYSKAGIQKNVKKCNKTQTKHGADADEWHHEENSTSEQRRKTSDWREDKNRWTDRDREIDTDLNTQGRED